MKGLKFIAVGAAALMLTTGCGSAAQNGMLIGGGGGAALGALVGHLIGGNTTGRLIGTAAGAALGTGAGYLIGKKMDKAKAAAQQVQNAQVETIKDANGNDAIKVSFDNGILFQVGKYALQPGAQSSLKQFADKVLNVYTDCDVAIYGFASSDGSDASNLTLSQNRAKAVSSYLTGTCAVSSAQVKDVRGFGEDPNYLIKNQDGSENVEASRRVEVLLYASDAMIKAAQNGTLK